MSVDLGPIWGRRPPQSPKYRPCRFLLIWTPTNNGIIGGDDLRPQCVDRTTEQKRRSEEKSFPEVLLYVSFMSDYVETQIHDECFVRCRTCSPLRFPQQQLKQSNAFVTQLKEEEDRRL
ncbi:hypothetical protein L1887_08774 [Cichorium endivia]|nr:hypothetical protein L1887_08774 [Cichorium endivia]